jgi:hypothetical protein
MKQYGIFLSTIVIVSFFSSATFAGASKFYDDLETGKCSTVVAGSSNGDRMKKNAVSHAKAWCQGSGGVSVGASTGDYSAATEGSSPYWCRVKGTIECNQ